MFFRLSSAAVVVLIASTAAAQQQDELPIKFTAVAMSVGGPRSTAGTELVDITINRWSTPEEEQRLMRAFKQEGNDAMLETLQDLEPVGTISTPGNLAYDLHFAQQDPGEDGGRRIIIATDRPISYWEAVRQPRVSRYPFTFIELRMQPDGEGEGKLALATRVQLSYDQESLELVNYTAQPIQLSAVRRVN